MSAAITGDRLGHGPAPSPAKPQGSRTRAADRRTWRIRDREGPQGLGSASGAIRVARAPPGRKVPPPWRRDHHPGTDGQGRWTTAGAGSSQGPPASRRDLHDLHGAPRPGSGTQGICRTTSPTTVRTYAFVAGPTKRRRAVQSHAEGTDHPWSHLPQHRGAAGRRPRLRRTLQCPVDRRKERLPEPRSSSSGVARRANPGTQVRNPGGTTCILNGFCSCPRLLSQVVAPCTVTSDAGSCSAIQCATTSGSRNVGACCVCRP